MKDVWGDFVVAKIDHFSFETFSKRASGVAPLKGTKLKLGSSRFSVFSVHSLPHIILHTNTATRFGEILPLWQNFKSILAVFGMV